MAQTNGHAEVLSKQPTPTLATQLSTLDEVLEWSSAECLGEFHELVQNPPLRSVVIRFSPEASEQLLLVANNRNRPLQTKYAKDLGLNMEEGEYGVTGDTIKFSKAGELLDGQHRLSGSVRTKQSFTSHVIFGLEDEIFDILDQGRKRTAADVLALCGVKDYSLIAAAIRWVVAFERNITPQYLSDREGKTAIRLTPRGVRLLALGRLKGVADYANHGVLINKAFKHPPSLITAVTYSIAKHDRSTAENFIHEWAHGSRIGRNENFDILSRRLMAVQNQGGGRINTYVRAAMIVQTFNHWHAGEVASARGLTWRMDWKFPSFMFNKDAFQKTKRESERQDTSLTATQLRVIKAMSDASEDGSTVRISHNEIAANSNTPRGSVPYIVATLVDAGMLRLLAKAEGNKAPVYEIKAEVPAGK